MNIFEKLMGKSQKVEKPEEKQTPELKDEGDGKTMSAEELAKGSEIFANEFRNHIIKNVNPEAAAKEKIVTSEEASENLE